MILQALKEYYDRKAADPNSDIAPEGFEKKELQFLIVIDENGKFIELEDTREKIGKKLLAKPFLLPRSLSRSGGKSYETTFLLWDHIGYVLGQPDTDIKSAKQHTTWLDSLKKLTSELKKDVGVKAIISFYENKEIANVIASSNFAECLKLTQCNMAFRLSSDMMPIPCRPAVQNYVKQHQKCTDNTEEKSETKDDKYGFCIVTGENGIISRIHGKTPIDKDTKNLIGFQKNCGYDSYGKEQGYNAPIIKSTEFAYVTALNTLLRSKQRIQIGDTTTVFWSEKKSTFENDFSMFFSEPPKDNPDEGTERIKELYKSVQNGAFINSSDISRFYVLGLSPNAARISVRFWQVGLVSEFAERIKIHFDDLAIVKPTKEPEFYSIWRLLVNIASQDKSENIPPNIAGDFMRAILNGTQYPATLLQAALRRIHSDTENRVKPVRAALIKAYLNRYHRIHINPNHKEITMSLDTNQPSVGYQLGRLFATLEKIQEEANPGLNATIRERYYGSECASPVTVFANLMRLKNHHLAKIENRGRVKNLETLLGEIMGKLIDFPAHLDLHEQGRFAIGYYHQRQEFFTKKEDVINK
ncbi:MAG: type I-C CRISPR-associated protein Cas8c/Csd1 [Fibrobacter sp.]|nr:type I-C CRISPR-associated protein Cas8c/Csd1 [Fibrobacter sp.]